MTTKEMTTERLAYLKDKLQSWPGEMALASEDIADLIAMLDDHEGVKAEVELLNENAMRDYAGHLELKARAEKAEAELARYAPVIEAVGGPGEAVIEWDGRYTTKAAGAILRAALACREGKP